jgi:hypothetical protein
MKFVTTLYDNGNKIIDFKVKFDNFFPRRKKTDEKIVKISVRPRSSSSKFYLFVFL